MNYIYIFYISTIIALIIAHLSLNQSPKLKQSTSELPDVVNGVLDVQMGSQGINNEEFQGLMVDIADKNKHKTIITLKLNFTDNNISDIQPLSQLSSLRFMKNFHLNLEQNEVEDIDYINIIIDDHSYNLEQLELNFKDNKAISSLQGFQDIGKVTNLQIFDLNLAGRQKQIYELTDLTNLQKCKNLQKINLNFNGCQSNMKCLQDIYTLNEFTQFTKLTQFSFEIESCYANQINFISGIQVIENLKELHLNLQQNQGIKNSDQLSQIGEIKLLNSLTLNMSNTLSSEIDYVKDIISNKNLQNLSLDFSQNQIITDITSLKDLNKLKNLQTLTLNFENNSIKTQDIITYVSKNTQLQQLTLNLNYNRIPSIDQVSLLQALTNLNAFNFGIASNDNIEDISAISDLANIKTLQQIDLDFRTNYYFKDLKPLAELKNMDLVHLSFNFYDCYNLWNIDPLYQLNEFKNLEYLFVDVRQTDVDSIDQGLLDSRAKKLYPFAIIKTDK